MSPKDITQVDITEAVFREPIEVIKHLTSNIEGLQYTKVIQTFVMENRKLDLSLENQGFKGKVVWIGNRKDDTEGTVFCVDKGNELKQISPTPENTEQVILDLKKETIRIDSASKSRCAVCGKPIEIFDEVAGCPLCDSKSHKDHLIDWVKMKHSCPVCKKSLNVSSKGIIFID